MLEVNAKPSSENKESLNKFANPIFTNPNELHGSNYVTEEVEQSSKITAGAVSVSNLIDALSTFPLLLYSVKDMGSVGFIVALLLALAQTKFTNGMGKAVATRKPGNEAWSTAATVAMLLMNLIMSLTSLVAPELSLNQPHLADLRAQELVKEQEKKVNDVKPDLRAADDAEAKCKDFQNKAANSPEGSPARNDYYTKANGLYEEKNRDWRSVLVQGGQVQIPYCPLAKLLREDALKTSEATKTDWENKKAQIVKSSSYVVGIKQTMPDLYQQHFEANGTLISGTEATRLAIESTTEKLMGGKWNALGFSLFFFAVSVFTSGGACALAITHSLREDVQMSFNESLQIEFDEFWDN